MSKRLKNLKGIVTDPYTFSVLSKIFCVLVGFLFTVFQSRFLGPEIKGQVATVNSYVSISCIVCSVAIYQAYPYYKRNTDVDIMPIFLKLAVLMLAVYTAIAACIVCLFSVPLKYAAVLFLTPVMVYDGIIAYITLVETPFRRNLTDVIVMAGELILVILLWLVAKPSFLLGLVVITVKDLTKSVIFTFWWRNRIFVSSESIWKWLPKLVRFGFFPMLSLLMANLNYRVGVIMLNGRVPDAAIGVYSVGILIAERVWMIPDAMKGVMVSKLTKGKDAGEVAYVIRVCNTACLILVAGIVVLGKPFISLFFGPEYDGAYQVTLLLLLGVFPMIYYRTITAYNTVMGMQMASFLMLCFAVLAGVAGNYLLIPEYGIYGAGMSSVISYLLCSVLFIVFFWKKTSIPLRNMLFVNGSDLSKLKRKFRKK